MTVGEYARAAAAAGMSPEEYEALMNEPQMKQLLHHIQHGTDSFKIDRGGEGPAQPIRNIVVPEGASQEDIGAALQREMAAKQANEARQEKAKAAEAERQKQERNRHSDAWSYELIGAGSAELNGVYLRQKDGAKRNGARVYEKGEYVLSREVIGGGAGFIVGKAPRAFYAYQTGDTVAPESGWSVQEHGLLPAPTVRKVEPAEAVEQVKQEGNAQFRAGDYEAAASTYSTALGVAAQCDGAHGLSEEVRGKLLANRAEAWLQLARWQQAEDDARAALEYDPCFVKAYVRVAKACEGLGRWDDAAAALREALEVEPANKELLARLEEQRIAARVRAGTDQSLGELAALCARLGELLRSKGSAAEVVALLRQVPTLLRAIRAQQDPSAPEGTMTYVEAPNHDAQVFLRLSTSGFALLAPLVRPNAKRPELLRETLETLAAALRECATNQAAFDPYVRQLVPLLRAHATLPFEVLRAAVKLLGAMAHRASARRLMHDPASAEGLMAVLSHPDSGEARPATAIITAIDELNDVNTLATLLAVPGACDTFWRESHSRHVAIQRPARSLIARAFGHAVCRKRLRLVERCKRVTTLLAAIVSEGAELERYEIAPLDGAGGWADDASHEEEADAGAAGAAGAASGFVVRDATALGAEPERVLLAVLEGLAPECAASAQLVEAVQRLDGLASVCPLVCAARPPLSTAALRLLRVCMGQSEAAVETVVAQGVGPWLLECREHSEHADELDARVRATLLTQAARDDAAQVLGYAANHAALHAQLDLYEDDDVLHHAFGLVRGSPSDDAACAGCLLLHHLVRYQKGKRRHAVRAADVDDVLVPLWLHTQDAAKDAVGKVLRCVLGDRQWMDGAAPYFEARGKGGELARVVHEMNAFDELKQMRTTGQRRDQLRPGGMPLASSLESDARKQDLQPAKVASGLCASLGLAASAIVVDVGAGTGLFALEFAALLPSGRVFPLEVRSDALRALHARSRTVSNMHPMRMEPHAVPALPGGARAELVFMCDVFESIEPARREGLVRSLRGLLAPSGQLVVIERRELETDAFLVDILDAGFRQQRTAQHVAQRRLLLFGADPAAPPPPPLTPPPPLLDEDVCVEEDAPPPPAAADAARLPSAARSMVKAAAAAELGVVAGDNEGCVLKDEDSAAPREVDLDGQEEFVLEDNDGDALREGEECVLEDNDGDALREGEECVLEDNDGDAHGDGCVLEDNDGDANGDGCVLEEN